MTPPPPPIPDTQTAQGRRQLRQQLLDEYDGENRSSFIARLPKVELHVHLEGTMTPALRWELARRNGMLPVRMRMPEEGAETGGGGGLTTLRQVEDAYASVISSAQLADWYNNNNNNNNKKSGIQPEEEAPPPPTFFQAYYSGCSYLVTRADFFDLAWDYFVRADRMGVRYAEVFLDPQSHASRGVAWSEFMGGVRDAMRRAERELGLRSGLVVCFLREGSAEEAMGVYERVVGVGGYRDMVLGFGLDGNETGRPPGLFDEVFARARRDGFRITAHCDVGQRDTMENIRHVARSLGGGGGAEGAEGAKGGADRVDHGLNAADDKELYEGLVARRRGGGVAVGLTVCPWAYLRRWGYDDTASRMRTLRHAGVRMCVSSDSPAYQDDCWVLHSVLLARKMWGPMSDAEVLAVMRDSVEMTWAGGEVKAELLRELEVFGREMGVL